MSVQQGDYVLYQERNEHNKVSSSLIKVTSVKNDTVKGIVERVPHLQPSIVSIPTDDVKVNFGSKLPEGVAFGVDLSAVYRGKKSHDTFGDVHFFTKVSKDQGERLWKAFDRVSSKLAKHRLDGLLSLPTAVEVHKPRGKYAGWFKRSNDPDTIPHRIAYTFQPNVSTIEYVVAHELGHLAEAHILRHHKEHWAKWIRLYNASISPVVLSVADQKQYKKDLLQVASEGLPLKKWLSSLDVEERRKANTILGWIRKVHSLSVEELDTLVGSEEEQEIHSVWPCEVITTKGVAPLVTEYATLNVKELWAESFALYLCGKELPKEVTKLLEKALSIIANELKG